MFPWQILFKDIFVVVSLLDPKFYNEGLQIHFLNGFLAWLLTLSNNAQFYFLFPTFQPPNKVTVVYIVER
ncbi:hypothetical protein FGO68_gene1157 [Halteria grandinella]|uniref:Uncharacterized protein n=1 Tax=Halteria grandinella TaxID=5974 RepID=A0A8J8NEY1_HALGN|nr:hypothetical protein FGO68_gene1157 [Halteria grandinella]